MEDRIIGGQNAQEHAWSFIAYFYGCGATLIAKNWALTVGVAILTIIISLGGKY